MLFERKRRHFERYVEIGRILAKHGWESLLGQVGLARRFYLRGRGRGPEPAPVQVREALEELGPTFVKLGQVLSTRPDLLPPEYITELEKLQDKAPQVPFEEIRDVVLQEFGAPPNEVFAEFDPVPVAAASLGQTHLAILHDGRQVIVKVQRPGIRSVIENDLEIVSGVAHFLERHFENLRPLGMPDLADEFGVTLRQELDYTREGRNGDRFKENLADLDYVKVAETIWDYTTCRVLCMERIAGVKITDLDEIALRGYDRHQIARNFWRAYLKMIFVDGFFHGDPHPGNLVVLEGNVIGLLDYGLVGRLNRELKADVTMLLAEYVEEDSTGFSNVILEMSAYPRDLDRKHFERQMDRLLRQYYGAPVGEVRMGQVLSKAVHISARNKVQVPATLGLLVKVIVGIEAINKVLDPDYNLGEEAEPFIDRSVRSEFTLSNLRFHFQESLLYWKSLATAFPGKAAKVIDNMAEGSFRIIFHHEGLERPVRDFDQSINRLSFALISGSTLIASAMVLSSKVGPFWHGYPVISLVGFVVAFFFGVWLMVSIIRAGKLW